MSEDREPARLAKWPFYLADLVLSGVVVFVLYGLGSFQGTGEMVVVGFCVGAAALAAWISIVPWLKEHDASVQLNDSSNLKSSLEQIKGIEKIAELIRQSNAQWQGVQEASGRTVASAREITDKMKVEADEFMKFIANAHDQERAGLRLEVEKLRRMEADWIKVAVQMLDHIFALNRAAHRSGQQQLINQLNQFQNACRDVARRMGLATFVPAPGEFFDQRAHQLPNPQMTAQEGDRIQEVLASGFTYQGQLLRRSLVSLDGSPPGTQPDPAAQEQLVDNSVNPLDAEAAPPAETTLPEAEAIEPGGFSPEEQDSEVREEFQDIAEEEHLFSAESPEEPAVLAPETAKKKPSGQEELPL